MPDWNAAQHLRFSDERTRACRDVAARVAAPAPTVIDLGCGPGNSTAVRPAQRLMRDLDASDAWRRRSLHTVVDWRPGNSAFYYDALAPHASAIDI